MLDSGSATRPEASGQMPASARNRVDLPLPEGPCKQDAVARLHLQPGMRQQAAAGGQVQRPGR